jgi:DNA-binding response OmpR family regulator
VCTEAADVLDTEATASGVPDLLASASAETSLEGLRVLAVDDEPDARELVKVTLEQHGASVLVASSAQEALVRLKEEHFDVLIVDIGMPGEDGHSLVRRLREQSAVPAIALTAYSREVDRVSALAAGFREYLVKPLATEELVRAVRRSKAATEV